jgi:predicted transcriptional regulator of viral defense system
MKDVLGFFSRNHGYARTKELKAQSFQPRDIAVLIKQGKIEKIKTGLYRLADMTDGEISRSFIDVCKAMPKGVICLASALSYYELTTFNPSEIYVAIPNEAKYTHIECPPVKVYFFRQRFYNPGIETITAPQGMVKIYGMEKTICDMFRYRKKLGEDMALEALRNYLQRKSADIPKLEQFAKTCEVKTIITPYLKALIP